MNEEKDKEKFIEELKEYLKQAGLRIESIDADIDVTITKKDGEKMTILETAIANFLKRFIKRKVKKELQKLSKELIKNNKDNT
jgi:hypothetical protein